MAKAKVSADEFGKLNPVLQAEYTQQGDSYLLKVDEVDGLVLENVTGLKTTLAKHKAEVAELQGRVKAFDGLDPETARTSASKLKELLESTVPSDKAKAQLDQTIAQISAKHKAELEAAIRDRDSLSSQLEEALIVSVATHELAKQKADVDLLIPHVKAATAMKKGADGKYVARVLNSDRQSERITMKANSQDPMGIDEFIATDLKKRFPAAFGANGASGGGSESQKGKGGGGGNQLSEADARDPMKYRAAREAAIKQGRTPDSILPAA